MSSVYPAIYDFGLLPYALGDALTWNVKQCIRAKSMGFEQIDVYLCADSKNPGNVHQREFIKSDNYLSHVLDLMPAFHTNPMLRNVYLFQDRASLLEDLETLEQKDAKVQPVISFYRRTLKDAAASVPMACQIVVRDVSTHLDLNAYYEKNKTIPFLSAPKGCVNDARKICTEIGPSKFVVLTHFRLRQRDQSIGHPESERDSDFNAWLEFFKFAERKLKDVMFVLLGKIQEKPPVLLQQSNVIYPRLQGFNLGHELALFECCSMFLGSSSGFAAMANFSKIPYVITRMNPKAYDYYAIQPGQSCLPFATRDQFLSNDPEDVSHLVNHLTRQYKTWKASQAQGVLV